MLTELRVQPMLRTELLACASRLPLLPRKGRSGAALLQKQQAQGQEFLQLSARSSSQRACREALANASLANASSQSSLALAELAGNDNNPKQNCCLGSSTRNLRKTTRFKGGGTGGGPNLAVARMQQALSLPSRCCLAPSIVSSSYI
ncbi:MAG: hypothetical protein Q7T55_19500 [Solirubrobacteraceae bacterium]|nr:hypothetical protein [Solirubrobacteraceae bacterium]